MSGEFSPMAGVPSHSLLGFSRSLCEAACPPQQTGWLGTQLSLRVFLFTEIASYDQHLISARVPEDCSKESFILTDSVLHK